MSDYMRWMADVREKMAEREQALRSMTPEQMRKLAETVRSGNALLDYLSKQTAPGTKRL